VRRVWVQSLNSGLKRGRAGEGPGKGRGTEGDRARYLEYGVWDIAWRVRQ
jgi:hypothetical protein